MMEVRILKIISIERFEQGIFRAEALFPSENSYEVQIRDPFLEPGEIEIDQEQRLRWYFEELLSSPYTDREKAKRAYHSIAYYGESLFADLFKQNEALAEWRNLVNGLDKIRIQVYSQDPEFQAMHWEALKDPKEFKPYCLKGVEIIRTSGAVTPDLAVQSGSCLNLLMVTARPGGKNDIEYRTITRPVVETLEKNRMPVRVHLLRPPTFLALTEHLRDKKGFYHILHFDVHGSVLTYPVYKKIMEEKEKPGGRKPLEQYDGTRAFIDLVGETGGHDLVSAIEVAELLKDAHIPVCFLNACQSDMATNQKFLQGGPGGTVFSKKSSPWLDASLAMTFLEQGVRLVLGMGWSLTVTAARIMMKALYDALTRGEEPGTALNRARQALADRRCRFASPGLRIDLEDWLLPVTWGKGDFSIKLEKAHVDEKLAYLNREKQRKKELEGVKTRGDYGFLGRDVDILAIESLLLRKNILLVKGMGGTGKTTLLGHMADWWMKTGWAEHVFYFGYDRKPYHAEEILNTIAEAVMSGGDYGEFLVTPDVETKAMLLADFLKQSKETPQVLLVLDNMESITGSEQAVGSKLEKKEQEKLIKAVKCLLPSSIKILLGSRADEAWLGEQTFKDSVYVLEGLDRESRYFLAEEILKDTVVDDRVEFNRLMEILAGYPLAMEIILPNLKDRGAKELREALTGAGVDFKGGKVSEEIFKCINISFSLLSPAAQKSVLMFAPFTAFLNGMILEEYLKNLRESGVFGHLTKADLEEAINQGEKQGLLKEVLPGCYTIQPVFPFFLGQRKEEVFNETEKAALDQAFCGYMTVLAGMYTALMEAKEPGQKQMGFMLFKLDRENLYKALQKVLDNQGDFSILYFIFAQVYFQQPLYDGAIALMEGVVKKLDRYSKKEKEFLAQYAMVVGNLGTSYDDVKNFSEAKKKYKKALELLQQAGKRQETAVSYHQLGWVAQEERDFAEAKRNYREALKIKQEFNDRFSQASTYHHLGMVAEAERDFSEARRNYREALKICQEFNDRFSQVNSYIHLGIVATKERNFAEAKRNYREALKIQQEFNDRFSQASTYHNLGAVAQDERDFAEAKRNYREALKICQEFNDRFSQARTYHQLGIVAQEELDFSEAKRNYNEAFKIQQEFNDRHSQAGTYHQLGKVAEEERDFSEAKRNYREALKIFQEFNDRYSQASTYVQMGIMAEAEKDYASFLGYYAAAMEIFLEYNDRYKLEKTIGNLAVLMKIKEWDAPAAISQLEIKEETKKALLKILEEAKKEK